MIQRCLLRQSRAISSNISRSHAPSSSRLPISALQSPRIPSFRPIAPSTSRWYSTPPDANSETAGTAGGDGASRQGSGVVEDASSSKKEQTPEDPIKKELDAKSKEVVELKDKYLRSVADFRNLQERTKRDISSARDFAISRFAKDLVDSVDNLDRALGTVPADKVGKEDSNKDLENLYNGLKMTEGILLQTLSKHGLERFDPSENGEKFDPNLHEATFMAKMEGKEDGTAFNTIQKGFKLNGRVIRAAKVGVVKNS